MSTPSKTLGFRSTLPTAAANQAVDDAFMPWIARLATARVHEEGQRAPGMLRPDGLSAAVVRALALRWCVREQERHVLDHCAVQGLQMALECYTETELAEMVIDAALAYGIPIS